MSKPTKVKLTKHVKLTRSEAIKKLADEVSESYMGLSQSTTKAMIEELLIVGVKGYEQMNGFELLRELRSEGIYGPGELVTIDVSPEKEFTDKY